MHDTDIAIVGGGIAGLTAAVEAARGGMRVRLFERSERVGGRGISAHEGDFTFNLGPHALYDSHFRRALDDFGVPYSGRRPKAETAERAGRFHRLPINASNIATTRLLGMRDRFEFASMFTRLMKPDDTFATTSIRDWLDANVNRPRVRETAEAIFRLVTYANAPDRISIDAIPVQAQGAAVLYIDHGWQTLIDGLERAAERAGVTFVRQARVERVARAADGYTVTLADGRRVTARSVILAVEPTVAAKLVEGPGAAALQRWADAAVPVRAACLDVALSKLPNPRRPFALSIDTPQYVSVHTTWADLAPPGAAIVSAARYLSEGEDGSAAAESLEALLDRTQPGWRDYLIYRRFMPALVVAQDVPKAANGGLAGRPGPEVPGAEGLFVAGDWVGPEGMLSDAAAASGRSAARSAIALAGREREALDEPVRMSA